MSKFQGILKMGQNRPITYLALYTKILSNSKRSKLYASKTRVKTQIIRAKELEKLGE